MSNFRKILHITLNLLIFAAAWFAVFGTLKWLEPPVRGFFCNDDSLKYPYREDTIDLQNLLINVFVVPTLVILAVELFKYVEKEKFSSTGHSIRNRLTECCMQIGYYMFGLALLVTGTEIIKSNIGRLRPHFLAFCQPQMPDGTTCADAANYDRFIEDYICQAKNRSTQLLTNLKKSFPSAHSANSAYSMFYTAIYLQAKLSTRGSKLLKHLLQFIFVITSWYIALTRITDYAHHWSDVVVGILLGTIHAFVCALFLTQLFGNGKQLHVVTIPHVWPTLSTVAMSRTTPSSKTPTTALPPYTFRNLPQYHYT